MSAEHHVIAIDGPAASGKSSVARELADRLGFIYVNSGAMYRAVTWLILKQEIDPAAADRIARLIAEATIGCQLVGTELRLLINNTDPTKHLRDEDVNNAVSRVSMVAEVRRILGDLMRDYAREHDLVTEGRDIGSVVFPETPFKFYIDASPDVRSRRRAAQGEQDEIVIRDKADSSRATAPLIVAADAELVDSSQLTIHQVVAKILERLREKNLMVGGTTSSSVP